MPASEQLEQMAVSLYAERFGVVWPQSLVLYTQERQQEVWATTMRPLPGLQVARPPGLRVARWLSTGMKPTSLFLRHIGDQITRSRVLIRPVELQALLRGQRIPFRYVDEGFVALEYAGDVIGCGEIRHGTLQALVPTGHRRELLEILFDPPRLSSNR